MPMDPERLKQVMSALAARRDSGQMDERQSQLFGELQKRARQQPVQPQPMDVRSAIAKRKASPPPNAYGDGRPDAQSDNSPGWMDYAGAFGKGVLKGAAGLFMVPGENPDPVVAAANIGADAAERVAMAPPNVQNSYPRSLIRGLGAIPVVGAVPDIGERLAQPTVANLVDNRPATPDEQLGAMGAAGEIGGFLGGPKIAKAAIRTGQSVGRTSARQYMRATTRVPERIIGSLTGSDNRPFAREVINRQIGHEGPTNNYPIENFADNLSKELDVAGKDLDAAINQHTDRAMDVRPLISEPYDNASANRSKFRGVDPESMTRERDAKLATAAKIAGVKPTIVQQLVNGQLVDVPVYDQPINLTAPQMTQFYREMAKGMTFTGDEAGMTTAKLERQVRNNLAQGVTAFDPENIGPKMSAYHNLTEGLADTQKTAGGIQGSSILNPFAGVSGTAVKKTFGATPVKLAVARTLDRMAPESARSAATAAARGSSRPGPQIPSPQPIQPPPSPQPPPSQASGAAPAPAPPPLSAAQAASGTSGRYSMPVLDAELIEPTPSSPQLTGRGPKALLPAAPRGAGEPSGRKVYVDPTGTAVTAPDLPGVEPAMSPDARIANARRSVGPPKYVSKGGVVRDELPPPRKPPTNIPRSAGTPTVEPWNVKADRMATPAAKPQPNVATPAPPPVATSAQPVAQPVAESQPRQRSMNMTARMEDIRRQNMEHTTNAGKLAIERAKTLPIKQAEPAAPPTATNKTPPAKPQPPKAEAAPDTLPPYRPRSSFGPAGDAAADKQFKDYQARRQQMVLGRFPAGPPSSPSSTTRPYDDTKRRAEEEFSEYAGDGRYVPENNDFITTVSPYKYLPARFKTALNTTYGSPINSKSGDALTVDGAAAHPGSPDARYAGLYKGDDNSVLVSRKTGEDRNTMINLHEFGHVVYDKDLTRDERKQWEALHRRYAAIRGYVTSETTAKMKKFEELEDRRVALQRKGNDPTAVKDLEKNRREIDRTMSQIRLMENDPSKQSPRALAEYKNDPWHSFAPMFAHYIANPTKFEKTYPDMYGYFKNVFGGKEFKGANKQASGPAPPPMKSTPQIQGPPRSNGMASKVPGSSVRGASVQAPSGEPTQDVLPFRFRAARRLGEDGMPTASASTPTMEDRGGTAWHLDLNKSERIEWYQLHKKYFGGADSEESDGPATPETADESTPEDKYLLSRYDSIDDRITEALEGAKLLPDEINTAVEKAVKDYDEALKTRTDKEDDLMDSPAGIALEKALASAEAVERPADPTAKPSNSAGPPARFQPTNDPSQSFAPAFARYTSDPAGLKAEAPEVYNYFQKLFGRAK
jgi:hypothetical protein